MNEEVQTFQIELSKTGPMQFTTKFDRDYPDILFDEPKRAGGKNEYPNASRVLTASVANCLAASLTFCMAKTRIEIPDLTVTCKASCYIKRNEEGRWRISKIDVQISPKTANYNEELTAALNRCKDRFADYCITSQSVKQGINVTYKIN
jgi:uncharacterized OsmC-like protein